MDFLQVCFQTMLILLCLFIIVCAYLIKKMIFNKVEGRLDSLFGDFLERVYEIVYKFIQCDDVSKTVAYKIEPRVYSGRVESLNERLRKIRINLYFLISLLEDGGVRFSDSRLVALRKIPTTLGLIDDLRMKKVGLEDYFHHYLRLEREFQQLIDLTEEFKGVIDEFKKTQKLDREKAKAKDQETPEEEVVQEETSTEDVVGEETSAEGIVSEID